MGMFTTALRRPSVKFPTIGTSISGRVSEVRIAATPDFDDNGRVTGPRFDIEGNVVSQIDVSLMTDGGKEVTVHTGGAIFEAIQAALAAVKSDDLVVGDTLTVEYIGDGVPAVPGFNPPKQYAVTVSKA